MQGGVNNCRKDQELREEQEGLSKRQANRTKEKLHHYDIHSHPNIIKLHGTFTVLAQCTPKNCLYPTIIRKLSRDSALVRISIYLFLTGKLLYCTAGSCCAFKESLLFADRVKHPALTYPAESIKLQGSLRTVALALRSTECCAWTPLICPGITQIPVQLHLSSPAEARPRAD